jgi:lysophospholipase L1-like esterase
MKEICENRGMPFLDLYSESGMDIAHNSTHKSLFSSDGVHANDNGHQVVADKIFTKIEYGM